ncbi:Lon protease 1 (ATP-dependent protease La 1), partial [Durusdinium trenchii]
ERQQILETKGLKQRLELVLDYLQRESQAMRVSTQISESIQRSRDHEMRLMALQRQAQEIQRELQRLQQKKDKLQSDEEGYNSEEEEEDELAHLSEKLSKANLPEDASRIAKKELKRLKSLQAHHPEYTSTHSYLELLASLPWKNQTKESFDLQEARRMLDEDHRGLEKVKVRILEFLAVQKLRGGLGPFLLEDVRSHVNGSLDSDAMARKRMRSKQTSEAFLCQTGEMRRNPETAVLKQCEQDVDAVVKELEAAGFGRERPVMDMGCAYHDFSKGLLRVDLDLQSFPAVLALIEGSMESMSCRHRGVRGLNVIARHYEGPSEEDRLSFHADNFIVGEWVFGCILRQEGDNPLLALHFRERDGPGYVCMKEKPGHLYLQTGEARHHWTHGIPAGGGGAESLTWRWLRPSFLRWCELEHSLNRREQVCWLQRFICVGHSAGIDQE